MEVSSDIYQHIALLSDDRDILNMLSVNKNFNNPEFFKRIIINRYPLLVKYKTPEEDWKYFYLKMIRYIYLAKEEYGFPYIPSQNINPEKVYKTLVKEAAGKGDKYDDNIWAKGLSEAVNINRLDLVKDIVTNGFKYLDNINYKNHAIYNAAYNGYTDILNYLIDVFQYKNITYILEAFARLGNINFLKQYLNKYYQNPENYENINYNHIMEASIEGTGNIEIINLMISKGANNYNEVLYTASKRGYINIVKLMLSMGANKLNNALEGAAKNGQIDIVKLLLEKGATNFRYAFALAADRGRLDIMKLLINNVTHDDINNAMKYASIGNQVGSMRFLIDNGGDAFGDTLNNASYHGYLNIIKLLVPYTNKQDIEKALEISLEQYHKTISEIQMYKGIAIEYQKSKINNLKSTVEYLEDIIKTK